MNLVRGDLPDRLAAEYVLGTLRGGARRRFDALLPAHPALQHAVARWEGTLLPMALRSGPVAPSSAVWSQLESRLGWTPAAAVAAAPMAARALRFYQWLAAVATMAVLVLGVVVRQPPAGAPLLVVLRPASGESTTLVAGVSRDLRHLTIQPLQPVSLAVDRSLELWAVPRAGAPVSLGIIAANGLTAVQRRALPKDSARLAVTVEPLGGSQTGQPTGPIVFAGDLTL